jgi:hypothetical protein
LGGARPKGGCGVGRGFSQLRCGAVEGAAPWVWGSVGRVARVLCGAGAGCEAAAAPAAEGVGLRGAKRGVVKLELGGWAFSTSFAAGLKLGGW